MTNPAQHGVLEVSSPVFSNEGNIPPAYTCDGKEISPPLLIRHIPDGTQALAIIMEDPDAPKGVFDHWIAWNIPVSGNIAEGAVPGISGTNSAGKTGYHGPCPPSGSHRYYFHVFALDVKLHLTAGSARQAMQEAMQGHLLAKGSLMGHYQKATRAEG